MEGISLMMPNSPGIKSITINGKKIINEKVDGEHWLFNLNPIEATGIKEGMWTSAKQAERDGDRHSARILIEAYHNVNRYVDSYRFIQKYINQ